MLTPPLSSNSGPTIDPAIEVDLVDAPPSFNPTEPRGLKNSDGETCYINAPLQLILGSAMLRAHVMRVHPHGGFEDFFGAYDSPVNSADELQQHRDGIVAYLREHSQQTGTETSTGGLIPPHGAAQSSEAMSFLLDTMAMQDSPYVGLYLNEAEEMMGAEGTIEEGYAISVACKYMDGKRIFAAPALFSVDTVANIAELMGTTLVGFTYHEKGHYVAYVKRAEQWYRVDDSVAAACDTESVKNLPLAVPRTPTLENPEPDVAMGDGLGVEVFAFA